MNKQKFKLIWRSAAIIAFVTFIIFIPVFILLDAEYIASIILAGVCSVLLWKAVIFIVVRFWATELLEYIDEPHVERVGDEVEVESAVRNTGDSELDRYVFDYARARDFWGKTGMMLLVGVFLVIFYFW